jgi:hypothetical protein
VDGFTLMVLFFGAFLFLVFYALGKYHPKSGAEVLDWKPTRSVETEVELELEDVDQMLEVQNAKRRASGREELSEAGLRREVEAEMEEQRRRAEAFRKDSES